MIVSRIDLKKSKTNEWIELPTAFSKQPLPVERKKITTPNKIKPLSKTITQIT